MKPDDSERRSRDTRPQPAWRGADPATPSPAAPAATEEQVGGGGRILWEGRADPDIARRLARPWVWFGWIVVALATYLFASGLVYPKEKNRPPVFAASLDAESNRIVEVRVDESELLQRAALVAGLLGLFAAPLFLAPMIACFLARHRRVSFAAFAPPGGASLVPVRDDLPDGACRELLLFPEPVPSGRRPRPSLRIRGPFRAPDADCAETAIRRHLGLPPREGSAPAAPHAFPPWMTPDERARVAARLAPGERLLWVGRPAGRTDLFSWFLSAFALCGVAAACASQEAKHLCIGSAYYARQAATVWAPQLFSGEFGLAGFVFGAAWAIEIVVLFGLFALGFVGCLFAPWFSRLAERRRRFFVTDRRAWSDPPAARVSACAPEVFPPAVRRTGAGRSNVFFLPSGSSVYDATRASRWNAVGFVGVPDADLPAALAALEELRRGVASQPPTPKET